jgi:hypothetical protein
VLLHEGARPGDDLDVAILAPDAPLTTTGLEAIDRDTDRDARGAVGAVRAIDEVTAASKAEPRKRAVAVAIEWEAWVDE